MSTAQPIRRRRGFTLIEVLAAIFMTSLVMTAAVTFYVNLSDASTRAVEMMRERLHATTVLDRVGRDIMGANLLKKPAEADPFAHPWFFVADSQYAFDGADRIKLITRSHVPRVTAYHSSDLAVVVYFTRHEDDGSITLLRWVSPGLPARYDPIFPGDDDERSLILAEGLRSFSLKFLQEDGQWVSEWDSTQLVESSELPIAVEIKLAMLSDEGSDEDFFEEDIEYYTRRVVLPLRPLDLEGMIEAKLERAAGGGLAGLAGGLGREEEDSQGSVDCAGLVAQLCAQFSEFFDDDCNPTIPLELVASQAPPELQACLR